MKRRRNDVLRYIARKMVASIYGENPNSQNEDVESMIEQYITLAAVALAAVQEVDAGAADGA